MERSKILKTRTTRKTQMGNSLIKWQNQELEHIKRMENTYHISDMVPECPYEENGGFN